MHTHSVSTRWRLDKCKLQWLRAMYGLIQEVGLWVGLTCAALGWIHWLLTPESYKAHMSISLPGFPYFVLITCPMA